MSFTEDFIQSVRFEFERYKILGEKTFVQLSDEELHWKPSDNDNSITIIVKHMAGNMLSRWANFLTEDGEKSWRHRETEFENPPKTKEELMLLWEKGWNCLFDALDQITDSNFNTKIKIRDEEHSIIQATHRQLAHYANHVGQIVYMGRMIKKKDWQSPSIPKGGSDTFNRKMRNINS